MNSINDSPKYEIEGVRLTFEHFMSIDGKKIPLEEPIVAQCYFDRTFTFGIKPYVMNDVFARLKEEICNRVLSETENETY